MATTDDILDLRARVEALEQRRAATPAPEPAPAPDGRPLWEVMQEAWSGGRAGYAAEIDAVADWLAARGCAGSADMLRSEARRARQGEA